MSIQKRVRAKKDDIEDRVSEIIPLIFNGYNVYDLFDKYKDDWEITTIQQMYRYYNKALERIQEINNEEIRNHLNFELNRLEEFLKGLGSQDKRLRLETIKQIAKLKGLETTKIDLETKQPITINIVQPK